MKTVKMKIIKGNIKVEWTCPECKKLNVEWVYDDSQKKALHCYGCGEHFKGEIDVNL